MAGLMLLGCSLDTAPPAAAPWAEPDMLKAAAMAAGLCRHGGYRPGTPHYRDCVRGLLSDSAAMARARADRLADEAARLIGLCYDRERHRIARCLEI